MSTVTPSDAPNWTIRKRLQYPAKWPYSQEDFYRADESPDEQFYKTGRFVTHIDDHAIEALTKYYGTLMQPGQSTSILDLCGSWISHLPLPLPQGASVYGIGMNADELAANKAYTLWKVYDLNASKEQTWDIVEAETLDLVLCSVSIDYLIHPLEVLKECQRLMKPGGTIHLTISNRCFGTKVIALWLHLEQTERVELVENYLHFAGFEDIEVVDLVKPVVGRWEGDWGINDPIWVVRGRKALRIPFG